MVFHFFAKMLRWVLRLLVLLILSLVVFLAILQSKWAKKEIQKSITLFFRSIGSEIEISSVEGDLPISWKIDRAKLHFSNAGTLELDRISFRIAFLPLFKGRCEIDYIHINQGFYTFDWQTPSSPLSLEEIRAQTVSQIEKLSPPFSINLGHVGIDRMTLHELSSNTLFDIAFTGKIKFLPRKKMLAFQCNLFNPDTKASYLETSLFANPLKNYAETSLFVHLPSLPSFLPLQGEIQGNLSVKGPWESWQTIFDGRVDKDQKITGEFNGQVFHADCSQIPLLNGNWNWKSTFSLPSFHTLALKQGSIDTPSSHIDAHGSLHSEWRKSSLVSQFAISDLSPFSPRIKGGIQGKAIYKNGSFHARSKTEKLQFDSFFLNTTNLSLSGTADPVKYLASVEIASQDATIPFQGRFSLNFEEDLLSLTHCEIQSLTDQATGDLSYSTKTHLWQGSLHAHIEELNRFEPFFSEHIPYGSISADIVLKEEEEKQLALLSASGKFIRYADLLIDDLFIKTHIDDPWNIPKGGIYLLAQNVFTPRFYFDSFLIESESDPNHLWSFFSSIKGRTDSPFELQLSGSWKKESDYAQIELAQALGNFADLPLILDHPVEFSVTPTLCELKPLDLTLGNGHLHLLFHSSSTEYEGEIQTSHFPMQILHAFTPNLKMQGAISSSGFLKADKKQIHGAFNLALEEVELSGENKLKPLHSKGSLQMHLEQNRLQTHLDLKASGEQFVDAMGSFPILYNLHPFSLSIDPSLPLSAELTAEGVLEELFDFINLGTNHFKGLISCRLFLANTLLNPALLGHIDWQQGSYENDFTGIRLRQIEAELEAQNDQIQLLSLTGKDDQTGEVSTYGLLELKPTLSFPYRFTAEMQNLHAVDFDMIDCTLSGPVYFSGNKHEMFAEGNLLIDKAIIRLGERFPQEVPFLPFTYIHKPSQIDSTTLRKKKDFQFHMDLDVTANDNIKAEGVGLQADLTGHIRLQGMNTNIQATGALDLVKGEYLFAGKVFKLTEGHLAFNDKMAPFVNLNVSGSLTLSEATITVTLRGPITSPQLSFQSNPHKSTSSILALILFNKDISEINQMEAIQLASTLISISGGTGPNILESIRKTIGVDRLNISSRAGSDEITVQIGKYLTKGVMITLSQSATSSQVIVEVELPKGFVFQAETQEEQEGKFSLKWRKNY